MEEVGPDGGAASGRQGWRLRSMAGSRGVGGRALLGEDGGGVGDQGVGGTDVDGLDCEPGMGRFHSKIWELSLLRQVLG